MKNKEYIEYTYKHRLVVIYLAKKYFPNNKELLKQVELHDLDKLFLYLFFNKKDVSKLHRDLNYHHDNDLEKSKLDYIEMVLDWESARYTKDDKPLNAYDTLVNYYSNMKDEILPILKEMNIDKPSMPKEDDVCRYVDEINNISIDDIKNDLKNYLDLVL